MPETSRASVTRSHVSQASPAAAKLHKQTLNGLAVDKGIERSAQLRPSTTRRQQIVATTEGKQIMKYLINWLSNPEPVSLLTFMSPIVMFIVVLIVIMLTA
jgi:hypothetical protein